MNSGKIITFLLIILIILIIGMFSLFIFKIYNDDINKEKDIHIIEVSEMVREITPVVVSEDEKDEDKKLIVEPTVREEEFKEDVIVNSNKFYYKQLDKYSKLIYKSLEEQKEELKKGNSIIKLPDEISEIIETENAKGIFSIAINAFEYDNPDVFYLDVSKLVLYYEKDTSGRYKICLKNNEEAGNYLTDEFNTKKEVEQAERKIYSIAEQLKNETGALTTKQKILYIHDWIVDNVKYDETLSKTNKSNIYGTFIEREVTCAGYAKAFKYVMDKLNINCIIVQGTTTAEGKTENHAWNYVQIDNKWYGIDCTWDDPVIIVESDNGTRQKFYTYYLKGQNVFNNSHKPFETFYATNVEIDYPELEQNDFN